jgi:hypothetical protein
MFPFLNNLVTFDILGSELINLLTIVQAGPLGFYHTAGMKLTVSIDANQKRKFINATWADGS